MIGSEDPQEKEIKIESEKRIEIAVDVDDEKRRHRLQLVRKKLVWLPPATRRPLCHSHPRVSQPDSATGP